VLKPLHIRSRSYNPCFYSEETKNCQKKVKMVTMRVELMTLALLVPRSNQPESQLDLDSGKSGK
jgi:hypothetical protein